MHEYEIFIEEINPCGGEKFSKKTLLEAEADSPEVYVKENGRYPVLETISKENGDVVIVTGDGKVLWYGIHSRNNIAAGDHVMS